MIEEEIMEDLWPKSYRFLDILGLYCCVIDRKEWVIHTLAIDKPGEVVGWGGDMSTSIDSMILLID